MARTSGGPCALRTRTWLGSTEQVGPPALARHWPLSARGVQAPTTIVKESYTTEESVSGDLEDSFSSASLGDGVEDNASPQAEK